MMAVAMIDQFDFGLITSGGVHHVQLVQYAGSVRDTGNGARGFQCRNHRCGSGQTQHTGKERSTVHGFLLYQRRRRSLYAQA